MKLVATIGLLTIAAACTPPPAPVIPERDQIGPPPAAALMCEPPFLSFAQTDFVIADLDRGRACTQFVEQDECIVALFHDCSDDEGEPPRSWQGRIDAMRMIQIERTNEPASSSLQRSPTDCSGPLVLDPTAPIPTWAKLDCRLSSIRHGGLYFEKIPTQGESPILPFATVDASKRMEVIDDLSGGIGFADLFFLPNVGQVWIAILGGSNDERTGLWMGTSDATRLTKHPAFHLQSMHMMITHPSGIVYAADGRRVVRLDPVANQSRAHEFDVEVASLAFTNDDRLLVALTYEPATSRARSTFQFVSLDTLEPTSVISAPVAGVAHRMLALPASNGTSETIVSMVHGGTIYFVDSTLLVRNEIIQFEIDHLLPLFDRTPPRVGIVVRNSASYYELTPSTSSLSARVRIPGEEIHGAFYDAETQRIVFAMDNRTLLEWDPDPGRPLLQRRASVPDRVRLLANGAGGRIYALSDESGAIEQLTR